MANNPAEYAYAISTSPKTLMLTEPLPNEAMVQFSWEYCLTPVFTCVTSIPRAPAQLVLINYSRALQLPKYAYRCDAL
jgi:hypothetical protein